MTSVERANPSSWSVLTLTQLKEAAIRRDMPGYYRALPPLVLDRRLYRQTTSLALANWYEFDTERPAPEVLLELEPDGASLLREAEATAAPLPRGASRQRNKFGLAVALVRRGGGRPLEIERVERIERLRRRGTRGGSGTLPEGRI